MKAIDTYYNGRLYRSRLEARWAVFFDALGVAYDYEPEGFTFECTDRPILYLPDFWLRHARRWVEIKPDIPGATEKRKCGLLAAESQAVVVMLCGAPGPDVRAIGFFPLEDGFVEEEECLIGDPRWEEWLSCPDEVDFAANAALSARFEHGEKGGPFTKIGDVIERLRKSPRIGGAINRGEALRRQRPRQEGDETA